MAAAELAELKSALAEISDLERAKNVLEWDMEVWMPPRGESSRADQLSTMEAVVHERWSADRIGELLDEAAPYVASLPADADDACLVRLTRREWERKRRVPVRARRRDREGPGRGVPGVGEGAGSRRLPALPALARADDRAQAAVGRMLRAVRRPVRRRARRVRGGAAHGAGAGGVRRAPARADGARRGARGGG